MKPIWKCFVVSGVKGNNIEKGLKHNLDGLEPTTSRLQTQHSNWLTH